MVHWFRSFMLVLVLLAVSGCQVQAPPKATVKVAMGYIPNVQFTPMYVAMEKGYFEEENLDVELDYGYETDILALVGKGELKFAIASGEQVILARSRGLPLVYVFDWYNRFPVSVAALAEQGLQEPSELVGKTVGIPATFGASYIGWRALLFAAGIPEDQVSLQTIGYTQVAALTSGQVDAAVCYYMNEPVQLRATGHEVEQILVADYIDLPAPGIVTNEETVEKEPELVERLVRAFYRGLKYTLENPEEAFAVAESAVPEIGENREVQRAVLDACLDLWRSDSLGWSDTRSWEDAVDFMLKDGLIDSEVPVEELFTNRFVPKEG